MESSKNILVINAHPNPGSLCGSIAEQYISGAKESGYSVQSLNLIDLNFDLNFRSTYKDKEKQPLEKDLIRSQNLIKDSNHLVFIFPSWWGLMPALLKGWIDRTFMPGFAFQYKKGSPFPEQLLVGKSARIIITMDAPSWWYRWVNGAPGLRALRFATLKFCGIKPVKDTLFTEIRGSSKEKLDKILLKAKSLGKNGL
jgi:putative NADPH-quinone reductase